MSRTKTNLILYSALGLAVVVAIYSMLKTQKLQRTLKGIQETVAAENILPKRSKTLVYIDSMLIKGDYRSAINAYKEEYGNVIDDENPEIKFRIALAEQLMGLTNDTVYSDSTARGSVNVNTGLDGNWISAPSGVRAYDSLRFVIKKTRVQLEKIRKQLKKKSLGKYLTFKNTKSRKVHYVGQVRNNKANGYGVAILDTGSRYEGEWLDNLRHGQGSFYWKDGQYYEGEYENDRRNGKGSYFWPNGEKYVGGWKNDQRDGEGLFYSKAGKITKGTWKNDKLIQEEK